MSITQKEMREAKAAYMREYRKKNPQKIKEINDNYWKRKIEREKQKNIAAQEG